MKFVLDFNLIITTTKLQVPWWINQYYPTQYCAIIYHNQKACLMCAANPE